MAQTEHLGLHQWEASDSFLRTDFNEDFAKLDAAVGGLITVGTYTGTADPNSSPTAKQDIPLGFQPRFLVVRDTSYRGSNQVSDNWTPHELGFATPEHGHWIYGQHQVLKITAAGFTAGGMNAKFNQKNVTYSYLAVR